MYTTTGEGTVIPQVLPTECSGPTSDICQKLWGMNRIKAPTLWMKLTGAPTANGWVLRGSLLDDGVNLDHNDLKGQFNIADSFTPKGATPAGGRAGISGHGTHTSGTFVGAWDGGDPRGIVGVPGKAQAISCNMLPSNYNGAIGLEVITECIKHVSDKNASWISSNSWAFVNPLAPTSNTVKLVRDAIQQYVCDKGGIFVAAAGNGLCRDFPSANRICECANPAAPWSCKKGVTIGVDISDAGTYPNGTKVSGLKIYPAAFAEELDCVIAVASIGYEDATRGMEADQIHPTSNWGESVKIAGPGWDILSDWYNVSVPDLWLSQLSTGTSMATPHVSGAIYLLRNAFTSVSAADIIECVLDTAVDSVLPPSQSFYNDPNASIGGGILDVDAAYSCVQEKAGGGSATSPPPPPLGSRPPPPPGSTATSPPPPKAPPPPPGNQSPPPPGSTDRPPPPPAPQSPPPVVSPSPAPSSSPPPPPPPPSPPTKAAGVAFIDRTYSMQYGSCNSMTVPPTDLYTNSGSGRAPSVMIFPQGPYPPGVTVVSIAPTTGATSCASVVTVVPCKVKCNPASASAPTPPLGSTSCSMAAADAPEMVDAASLGNSMVSLTQNPPGPYQLGSIPVTFTAVYPGGVKSPSATCTLTVSAPAATPMAVTPQNTCIWRRRAATREYCFRPADLVAVTGGNNACTGGSAPRASSTGCGAGVGTSTTGTGGTGSTSRTTSGTGAGLGRSYWAASTAGGSTAAAATEVQLQGRRLFAVGRDLLLRGRVLLQRQRYSKEQKQQQLVGQLLNQMEHSGSSQQQQKTQWPHPMLSGASRQQQQKMSSPPPSQAQGGAAKQWPDAMSAFSALAQAGQAANEAVAATVAKMASAAAAAAGMEPAAAAAAAAAAEDSVVPAHHWSGFGGKRGYSFASSWYASKMPKWYSVQTSGFMYTWQGRWFTSPTRAASSFQSVGDSCRVSNTGMVCVQFSNAQPMQLATAQVTVSDNSSSQSVSSRISIWNQASATRPAGVPDYCVAA